MARGRRRSSELIDEAAKRRMIALYKQGMTFAALARRFGIGKTMVSKICVESSDVAASKSEALPVRRED